jgi:hypothetical protein
MMGAADNTYDRKRGRFENRLVGMIREEIYSYVAHKNGSAMAMEHHYWNRST